jgi:ribose transport system permease protein
VAGIDLSVGSVLGLSTVTGAIVYTATSGAGGLLALLVILLTGVVFGWINGFLYVKGKMPHPFIPTLASLYAARGLALVISDGRPIPGMSPIVVFLGSGYIGPIPMPVVVVAVLAALAIIVTRRLKWGRWIYAVGGDKEAARRTGIPVDRVLISVFVISGLMAGFAGVLTAGRTDAGFPTAGELEELTAIAAVIIGGASFFGGRGTVINVIVGALIIGVIQNGLNLLNVNVYYQLVATGVIVVIAVELDVLRRRLEQRFRTLQAREA